MFPCINDVIKYIIFFIPHAVCAALCVKGAYLNRNTSLHSCPTPEQWLRVEDPTDRKYESSDASVRLLSLLIKVSCLSYVPYGSERRTLILIHTGRAYFPLSPPEPLALSLRAPLQEVINWVQELLSSRVPLSVLDFLSPVTLSWLIPFCFVCLFDFFWLDSLRKWSLTFWEHTKYSSVWPDFTWLSPSLFSHL